MPPSRLLSSQNAPVLRTAAVSAVCLLSGVVEPLEAKLALLLRLVDTLVGLLRVDSVVEVPR